jgi:chemotaxis response regulator CheB
MVVDDEPGIRTALRANFLRHGWRVETASCVREAIRKLEGKEFDLVVTDIRMPDGTGMEVMRSARATLSPETAVILADGVRLGAGCGQRDARWRARLSDQADLVRPTAGDRGAGDASRESSMRQ